MKHLIYLFVLIGAMASTNVYAQELVKEDNLAVEEAIDDSPVNDSYSYDPKGKNTHSSGVYGVVWFSLKIVNTTNFPENIPSSEMETKIKLKVLKDFDVIEESDITLEKDEVLTYTYRPGGNLPANYFTEITLLQPGSSINVTYEWKR